jgi:hypothetical protein
VEEKTTPQQQSKNTCFKLEEAKQEYGERQFCFFKKIFLVVKLPE